MPVVKERRQVWMPILLMGIFALTRWPGLMPPNFSAAYGLAFCAGVYLPRRLAWWLPLATFLATDLVLNVAYYHTTPLDDRMLVNYMVYAAVIGLGRLFTPRSSWVFLLAGGLLGAIVFYVLTNTVSWMMDPAYPKSLLGWIQALTVGTPGWPHTWEFFRNTLLSGGLFTGLFAGAMKLSGAAEPEPEAEEESEEPESAPEESKA